MAKTNTHEAAEVAYKIKGIFENIREIVDEYLAADDFKNPDIAMETIATQLDKYNNL